jgi:hypothetical protein
VTAVIARGRAVSLPVHEHHWCHDLRRFGQLLEASDVNLADQFVRLIQARATCGVGVTTLKTASRMLEALTEINN